MMRQILVWMLAVAVGVAIDQPRVASVIEATVPCPWKADFSFDEPTFVDALAGTVANLTQHVYLFGTAGEGYAVSDRQFADISRIFGREMQKHVGSLDTACLGVISMSLPTVQERIRVGVALGFRTFQVSLPSWQALTDDEVFSFFEQTAGRFPNISFWHYNNPKAKKTLNATHYARLSHAFANFVGVKTCNNDLDWLRNVAAAAPKLRLFPNELGFALAKDELGAGMLISTASTNFARAKEFFAANASERMAMYKGPISAIDACMTAADGAALIDGAYDKQLSRIHTPHFSPRLLPPYTTSTEESFKAFVACACTRAKRWMPEGYCDSRDVYAV